MRYKQIFLKNLILVDGFQYSYRENIFDSLLLFDCNNKMYILIDDIEYDTYYNKFIVRRGYTCCYFFSKEEFFRQNIRVNCFLGRLNNSYMFNNCYFEDDIYSLDRYSKYNLQCLIKIINNQYKHFVEIKDIRTKKINETKQSIKEINEAIKILEK